MSALDKMLGKTPKEPSEQPKPTGPASMVLKMMGAFGLDQATVDKLGGDFAQTVQWFKDSLVTIHAQNVQILENQAAILAHLAELRDYAKGAVPNDDLEPGDIRS